MLNRTPPRECPLPSKQTPLICRTRSGVCSAVEAPSKHTRQGFPHRICFKYFLMFVSRLSFYLTSLTRFINKNRLYLFNLSTIRSQLIHSISKLKMLREPRVSKRISKRYCQPCVLNPDSSEDYHELF